MSTARPSSTVAEFERELEIFRIETQGAIQFVYAWQAIHDVAAADDRVLKTINRSPLFWRTNLGGLQIAAMIALGRVFDPDQGNHNVSRLLSMAHGNLQLFSKTALAERKRSLDRNADTWLPEYLRSSYEPTSADFRRLKRYLSQRRKTYLENYRDLRHKVFAHRAPIDEAGLEALFARTNIRELQKLRRPGARADAARS